MSNIKLSVSGVRVRNDEDLLNHDKLKEAELAPPVVDERAMQYYPPPPGEIAVAPQSLAPPPPAEPPIVEPPSAPRPDYSGRLADAQRQANDTRFMAGIGSAGQTLVENATGARGGSFYKDLEAGADQPVDDLKLQMSLDEAERKAAFAVDAGNPASRENRVAQAAFKRLAPALAQSLPLERMTKANIEAAMKGDFERLKEDRNYEKDRGDLQVRQLTEQNADALRAQNAKQYGRTQTETERHNLMMEGRQPFAVSVATGGLPDKVGARRAGDRILDYQKQTKPQKDLVSQLNEIERLAPGYAKGTVPEGLDPRTDWVKVKDSVLGKGIGQRFTEPQAQALRSAVMMFAAKKRHELAGASLTDYEASYYEQAFADAVASPPEVQAAVLDMFRRSLRNAIAGTQAGYKQVIEGEAPGMWQQYEQNPEAVTTGHPLFNDLNAPAASAAPPAAGGGGRRPPPGSGKIFVVRDGDGQRRAISPEQARAFTGRQGYRIVYE